MSKTNSPTWPHVLAFAERMEAKLELNRHKGNREEWLKADVWSLWRHIGYELTELMTAMENGAPAAQIANECADVANFCMMVADWYVTRNPSSAICSGCRKEIDPEVCHCGTPKALHGYESGHGFVPKGCDCGRQKDQK